MNSGHRRQHVSAWLSAAMVTSALLAGCHAPPTVTADVPADNPPDTQDHQAPAPSPDPTVCDGDARNAIETTITAQSLALGAGDFDTAYTFASPSFREAVNLEMFERVITRQYDMLLYFESARFGRCELTSEDLASVPVEVRSEFYPPVVMTYEMVQVNGTWFVSAVDNPVSGIPNA